MLFKSASYNLMPYTYPFSTDVEHAFGHQFANYSNMFCPALCMGVAAT